MKKRVISALLALMVVGTACGQKEPQVMVPEKEEIEEAPVEASTAESTVEIKETASESASEEASKEEEPQEESPLVLEEEQQEPIEGLYGEFLAGNEKVFFENTQFVNIDKAIENVFEKGGSYTLGEIIERVISTESEYDSSLGVENSVPKLIDCGKDGEKELLLSIRFPGFETFRYEEEDEYNNLIVIKELDGKLVARFYTANTNWYKTVIKDYGYLEASGPAYSGVGGEYAGYLDADVNWHLYYNMDYYLEAYDFTYWQETYHNIKVDTTSEDWSNVYLDEYTFDDKGEDKCIAYTFYEGEMPKIYPEDYPADNVYKKTLEAAGFKAYSAPEMEEVLKKRRQDIGLTDEIFEHSAEDNEIITAMFRYNSIVFMDGTFHNLDNGKVVTLDEFGEGITTDGTMIVDSAAYVDLDGKNGKEMILYFKYGGGIYLILSTIDGEVYGTMMTCRCFELLQRDGKYLGSGGAGDSYFRRLSIDKTGVTEETFAEYHDGVLTVGGQVAEDYDKWFSENYSDPAYFKEYRH